MIFDRFRSDEKRAEKLGTRASQTSPEELPNVVGDLGEFLDHEEAAVRQQAGSALYNVVDAIEYAVDSDHADTTVDESVLDDVARAIATLLEDSDPNARRSAAMAAANFAGVAPEALDPYVDVLVEFIERDSDDVRRSNGHRAVQELLDARPAAVTPAMLKSSDGTIRSEAVTACVTLARSEPDAVVPLVPVLLDRADDPESDVATPVAETLRQLARGRPDALAEALDETEASIPEAELPQPVAELAGDDDVSAPIPAEIADDIEALADRVEGDDPDRRQAALEQLLALAEEKPAGVARAREAVRGALWADDPEVRAAACRLLGRLGDSSSDARDRIEELRLDPNTEVSEAAQAATARFEDEETTPVTPAEPEATTDGADRTELLAGVDPYAATWRMVAGDPAHTGSYVGERPVPANEPTVRWRHGLDEAVRPFPPTADEEYVVVATNEGAFALAADSGELAWTYDVEGQPTGSPAIGDDTVYLATMAPDEWDDTDGRVHAIDRTSGQRTWVLDTERCFTPTVHEGTVYVGGAAVHAIGCDLGEERWQFRGATESDSISLPNAAAHPSLDPDSATVYTGAASVCALDAETGDVRWRRSVDERIQLPPIVTAGTVFAGGHDGAVYALDADTGEERWRRWIEGRPWVSATDGERLYLGDEARDVRALDAETGDDIWTHATDAETSPVAVADGVVLFGIDERLTALAADSGERRWTVDPGAATVAPAVANGAVYVASADGIRAIVGGSDGDEPRGK